MARRAVHDCFNALHIGFPGTIGPSVGVGNLNTKGNALVAKFALSHPLHLLAGNLDLSKNRQLLYISITFYEKQVFFQQKFYFFTKKQKEKKVLWKRLRCFDRSAIVVASKGFWEGYL